MSADPTAPEPQQDLVLPAQTTTPVPTVVGPPGPSEWAALQGMARSLANSGLVPRALQGNVDAVTLIVLTGRELGLPPVMALSHVHVVDGKPVLSAETMRALVVRAGHRLRIVESTSVAAVLDVQRKGEDERSRFAFTIDDAQRAGLTGKAVWKNYPQAMLLARVTSAACRAYFPDVLMGASYTAEELEPAGPVESVVGSVVEQPAPTGPRVEDIDEDALRDAVLAARSRAGLRAALTAHGLIEPDPAGSGARWHRDTMQALHLADAQGNLVDAWSLVAALAKGLPEEDPEPPAPEPDDDPGPEPITPAQLVAVNAAATDRGHTARVDRLAFLSDLAGRELTTSTDLTKLEARILLDQLADEQVAQTVVEHPRCPESACPEPSSHTNHLAWLAGGGMDRYRNGEDVVDAEVVDDVPDRSDQGVAQAPPPGTGYAAVRAAKATIAANHPQPSKDENR